MASYLYYEPNLDTWLNSPTSYAYFQLAFWHLISSLSTDYFWFLLSLSIFPDNTLRATFNTHLSLYKSFLCCQTLFNVLITVLWIASGNLVTFYFIAIYRIQLWHLDLYLGLRKKPFILFLKSITKLDAQTYFSNTVPSSFFHSILSKLLLSSLDQLISFLTFLTVPNDHFLEIIEILLNSCSYSTLLSTLSSKFKNPNYLHVLPPRVFALKVCTL